MQHWGKCIEVLVICGKNNYASLKIIDVAIFIFFISLKYVFQFIFCFTGGKTYRLDFLYLFLTCNCTRPPATFALVIACSCVPIWRCPLLACSSKRGCTSMSILGAFAKWRKATVSLVMSARPYGCQLGCYWRIFMKFDTFGWGFEVMPRTSLFR